MPIIGYDVSGAGDSSYNGQYYPAGTHNGETYYEISGGGRYLYWEDIEGNGYTWALGAAVGQNPSDYIGVIGAGLPANPWDGSGGALPPPALEEMSFVPDAWRALNGPEGVQYTPTAAEELSAIRAYLQGDGLSAQAAVYADDGTLLATSEQATLGAEGWYTLIFESPVSLSAGSTYYLMIWGEDGVGIAQDADYTQGYAETTATGYNTWADPGSIGTLTTGVKLAVEVGIAGLVRGAYGVFQAVSGEVASAYGVGAQVAGGVDGAYGVTEAIEGEIHSAYGREAQLGGVVRGAYGVFAPVAGGIDGAYGVTEGIAGRQRGAYGVTEAIAGEVNGAFGVEGGGGGTDAARTVVAIMMQEEGRVL